jgi:hypothetical protein
MVNLPDPADDNTADQPPIRPALRTPAEWQALYDRVPRLLAAVHSATRAVDDLHDNEEPPEDAAPDVQAAFESAADIVTRAERVARDKLIALMLELAPDETAAVAVVTSDGTVISFAPDGDGLAIVGRADVHKLGGPAR